MKKLLILLLFPLMMFSQDSTLVGDVDCSGEVNSQDASLILQFVTNVIDELPCEANMTGLTPDQLQEIIDMMDEQLSINYTGGGNMVLGDEIPLTEFNAVTELQAVEDGFLTAIIHLNNGYSRLMLYIDSVSTIDIEAGSGNINTENSTLRADFYNDDATATFYQTLCIPIKKGHYYYYNNFGGASMQDPIFITLSSSDEGSTTINSENNNLDNSDVYMDCIDMGVGEFCNDLSTEATLLPQDSYFYHMGWSEDIDGSGSGNILLPHWRKFQIHNLPDDFSFIEFRFNNDTNVTLYPLIEDGNVYFYIYHNYGISCSTELENVIPMDYAVNTFHQPNWSSTEIWYSRTNHMVDSGIRVDF
ncbi:MAG: hypothetical protein CBD51_000660 [Flavobacteriales bacterium TMED191]|nr:MAG: hypothetical protein CBD51_000660 [Flavobacteriales bacterium TMED191]